MAPARGSDFGPTYSAGDAYTARLAALHAELGIPPGYGNRYRMIVQVEAVDLVVAAVADDGTEVSLTAEASAAWKAMATRASVEGILLLPLSGFRSVARQAEIIRRKLANQPILEILKSVAAPGYSEHHTGRAIDIGVPGQPVLEEEFARTSAYAWLETRAVPFGFTLSYPPANPTGIGFEPWHWCFTPVRP